MEIWQSLEILRRPSKTLFFENSNINEKLEALSHIEQKGSSNLIPLLIDFLTDTAPKVRQATCEIIIRFFRNIDSKKVYYTSLNHCHIKIEHLSFYKAAFSKDQYIDLLAICSLNGNGYVREKAVKELALTGNSRAIPFLFYRMADWVIHVRKEALKGIEQYKSAEYLNDLIENITVLEWLPRVQRIDLSGVYNEILAFITDNNREYVVDNFRIYPDKVRFLLAKHLAKSAEISSEILTLFIQDRHFLIRSLAIDHFEKLNDLDVDQLLTDSSANIRLQTLYCLKSNPEFKNIVTCFLADNSATIRHFARFHLKEQIPDFAVVYFQNLENSKQVAGSLMGLAEMNAKHFLGTIVKFLEADQTRIRKTAFLAIIILDKETAYPIALNYLNSPSVGLRNSAINFFSTTHPKEVLEKARELYRTGNDDLKISMLKLFNLIGGWSTIPDLMIGTIDSNERIRQNSYYYLQAWKRRIVNLFTTPRAEETERAKHIFQLVYSVHEEKSYFKINPLHELDFYFD